MMNEPREQRLLLLVFLPAWCLACGDDAPTKDNSATTTTSATTTQTTTSNSDSSASGNGVGGSATSSDEATTSASTVSTTNVGGSASASTGTPTTAAATGGAGGSAGGAGGTGGTAGSGGGATAGCDGRDYLICEDFEATEVGGIPSGWSQHGEEASVADDEAHGGAHSLKLGAIPTWERRIYRDASVLGGAHWGRIHYKVQLPVPDAFVHSTLVALGGDGPTFGESEYRVVDTVKQAVENGSMHQFLYNVQPVNAGEFAQGGPYDFAFEDTWHCAEYFIDGPNQTYALYIDGEQALGFENGPGNYEDSDMPDSFTELRVGWINYQDAPPGFTAWIDDIAFDEERVGCLP